MSGITDEAARETHDVIDRAEAEERKVQGDNSALPSVVPPTGPEGGSMTVPAEPAKKESTLDKVKDALHINKK